MKKRFQSQSEDVTMPTRDAVKYGRVSSKEQEKEGFSIPAQWKLLDQYAKSEQFRAQEGETRARLSVGSRSRI